MNFIDINLFIFLNDDPYFILRSKKKFAGFSIKEQKDKKSSLAGPCTVRPNPKP